LEDFRGKEKPGRCRKVVAKECPMGWSVAGERGGPRPPEGDWYGMGARVTTATAPGTGPSKTGSENGAWCVGGGATWSKVR